MRHPIRKIAGKGLFYLMFVLVVVVFIFPVYWMAVSAIKPPGIVFAIPPKWFFQPTMVNFTEAFAVRSGGGQYGLGSFFLNSFTIAALTTLICLIIGSMAGYSMARYGTGGRALPIVFLVGKMLPPMVLILPFFILLRTLKMTDSHFGLVLVYTALNLPFCVWMSWSYFLDLPRELEEAALIDGCSQIATIYRIMLPIALPGLVSIVILTFVGCWNEFMFALTMTGIRVRTLPVVASLYITDEAIRWGPMTATCVVIMSVPILITIFAQRYIVEGLCAGAIKG